MNFKNFTDLNYWKQFPRFSGHVCMYHRFHQSANSCVSRNGTLNHNVSNDSDIAVNSPASSRFIIICSRINRFYSISKLNAADQCLQFVRSEFHPIVLILTVCIRHVTWKNIFHVVRRVCKRMRSPDGYLSHVAIVAVNRYHRNHRLVNSFLW